LIAAVVLASSLAGCSSSAAPAASAKEAFAAGSPTPPPASNLPDPCKLLTKAEAEAILGEAIKEPEANSLGGNRICDYKSAKLHAGIAPYSIHIAITAEKRQVWDAGKKMHTEAKELRPVAGLGEDAYFLLDDLEVFSKDRSININVMKEIDKPDHAQAVQQAERAVAEKILARL
jgi:hypothetical protein